MTRPIRIIGIDPGLRRTGWGVVEVSGSRLGFVACGIVRSEEEAPLPERLLALHQGLAEVLAEWRPDEAAIEETFVNVNAAATLKLGQARGVALLAPARVGLRIAEYAPNAIKKAVVGAGHADKGQIRMMVSVLLPKARVEADDEADALAVAICHAHHRGGAASRLARSG